MVDNSNPPAPKGFSSVDEHGRLVLRCGELEDGRPVAEMFVAGKPAALIEINGNNNPHATLLDREGRIRGVITLAGDEISLTLFNEDGVPILAYSPTGPATPPPLPGHELN